MEAIQKHSRLPRKAMVPTERKDVSVAKRPLGNIPAERRAEIANQVLERYIQGEQVSEMASEYQTSDVTIYALLLRERQEDWVSIQTARALARLERHQKGLEDAADALSLARARESVRSAQWELERLLRRLYGDDKAQVAVQITPILNISVAGALQESGHVVVENVQSNT